MHSRCAIAAWLECFQEKSSWCRNEQVWQGRISVKRFERSNGLDTALYKNIPFLDVARKALVTLWPLNLVSICKATWNAIILISCKLHRAY